MDQKADPRGSLTMTEREWIILKRRLAESEFRSRFRLSGPDLHYLAERGFDTVRSQSEKLIRTRLAPADPPNDGRQTPMRGHPCFTAQHATGCCCRGCLQNGTAFRPDAPFPKRISSTSSIFSCSGSGTMRTGSNTCRTLRICFKTKIPSVSSTGNRRENK